MRITLLLLLWSDLVDSIFFGNSCGCQQSRSICPPPPVCGPSPQIRPQIIPPAQYLGQCPPCNCGPGGVGIPISGNPANPTLIQTGTQFVSGGGSYASNQIIPSSGGTYATNQLIPGSGGNYATNQLIPSNEGPHLIQSRGPQLIPGPNIGPNLIPGPGAANNYQTGDVGPQANHNKLPSFFSTSRPHGKHSSRNSLDEDVYDEVLPTSGQQVADVSVDSKKLVPYDVYSKRNRFLKQLRNRALRQFSAKSLTTSLTPQFDEKPSEQPYVCNNEKLSKIMYNAMVDDIAMSKKLIRKAAELAFDGRQYGVLCAIGDFSYRQYCEVSKHNVTCFAFI